MKHSKPLTISQYNSGMYYNSKDNIAKLVNQESLKECQMWSDDTNLNKLEFTATPAIPKVKVERLSLPRWAKDTARMFLP